MNTENNKIRYFEKLNDKWADSDVSLQDFINRKRTTFIGFNSQPYDLPVLAEALKRNSTNQSIKNVSDAIIVDRTPYWKLDLRLPEIEHIDLIEPSPAVNTGLKVYGGRMHSKKLQDLPFDPSATVTAQDAEELRKYCVNDLHLTADLYEQIKDRIELREQLGGKSFRSKSDAQMAEALFKQKLNAIGIETERPGIPKQLKYSPPSWVEYTTPELTELKNTLGSTTYQLHPSTAKPIAPEHIEGRIIMDRFGFGMGGLHSKEKGQSVVCKDDELLFEIDFASFYPHIILREKFYPKHLTDKFLEMYGALMKERLTSKRAANTLPKGCEEWYKHNTINNGYKIAINGSFGKLGSKYSFLFSPELMLHVTLSGQLILLMLIEKVEAAGGVVISANTDGVVVHCHKSAYDEIFAAYLDIEISSGIELEETRYKALYSQSVNCYVAVKDDGSCKGKGLYASPSLQKSPMYEICSTAVKQYLTKGVPLIDTIHTCKDITQFLAVKKVTGGAVYQGKEIGKVIRFYHSGNEAIHYKKNGNKVPTSDGCKPLMNLPDESPIDVNYAWYVKQSVKMLKDLGHV